MNNHFETPLLDPCCHWRKIWVRIVTTKTPTLPIRGNSATPRILRFVQASVTPYARSPISIRKSPSHTGEGLCQPFRGAIDLRLRLNPFRHRFHLSRWSHPCRTRPSMDLQPSPSSFHW